MLVKLFMLVITSFASNVSASKKILAGGVLNQNQGQQNQIQQQNQGQQANHGQQNQGQQANHEQQNQIQQQNPVQQVNHEQQNQIQQVVQGGGDDKNDEGYVSEDVND